MKEEVERERERERNRVRREGDRDGERGERVIEQERGTQPRIAALESPCGAPPTAPPA